MRPPYLPGRGKRPRISTPSRQLRLSLRQSPVYITGFKFFEAAYFWEAHEAWEALWHYKQAQQRQLLKALIQISALGIKAQQGQHRPAQRLYRSAVKLLEQIRKRKTEVGGLSIELCLQELQQWSTHSFKKAKTPQLRKHLRPLPHQTSRSPKKRKS